MNILFADLNGIMDGEHVKSTIKEGNVIVVREFFSQDTMSLIEDKLNQMRRTDNTWMPLDDDCVDYRRINDEYPGSYVRARTHSFMVHFFNGMNVDLKAALMKLWHLKLRWDGVTEASDVSKRMSAKPSDGYIPRLVSHLYPSGGGYLAPHKDPVNPYNPIQTLICGSTFGKDFQSGGLYIKDNDGKEHAIDPHTSKGDLLIFDQSFSHEVKPVDPGMTLDWESMSGRLQHVVLFTRSDYLKGKVPDVES